MVLDSAVGKLKQLFHRFLVEQFVVARVRQDLRGKSFLEHLSVIDLLLHGVVDEQAVDHHLMHLATVGLQAEGPVRRLLVDHRVPVRIEDYNLRRRGQVEAKPTDLGRHEEYKDVVRLSEGPDNGWSVCVLHLAIKPHVLERVLLALFLDDVEHCRSLAEDQHALLAVPLLQEAEKDLQLRRQLDVVKAFLLEGLHTAVLEPLVVLEYVAVRDLLVLVGPFSDRQRLQVVLKEDEWVVADLPQILHDHVRDRQAVVVPAVE